MIQPVLFYLFALVSILSGLSVILSRSPISSALSLVVCFFALAANYVLLDAHFVAVMQVLVYAGAIMVLFIFVIMLLNLREEPATGLTEISRRGLLGGAVAGLLGTGLITALGLLVAPPLPSVASDYGTVADVGRALFSDTYLLPFETVSALLTVALVGAVVLAKKET